MKIRSNCCSQTNFSSSRMDGKRSFVMGCFVMGLLFVKFLYEWNQVLYSADNYLPPTPHLGYGRNSSERCVNACNEDSYIRRVDFFRGKVIENCPRSNLILRGLTIVLLNFKHNSFAYRKKNYALQNNTRRINLDNVGIIIFQYIQ